VCSARAGKKVKSEGKTPSFFHFYFQLSKALSSMVFIISLMCDYMYYEHKQRGKVKNLISVEEPELEKVEEHPMTVKA
jgi:hypothetical protein